MTKGRDFPPPAPPTAHFIWLAENSPLVYTAQRNLLRVLPQDEPR